MEDCEYRYRLATWREPAPLGTCRSTCIGSNLLNLFAGPLLRRVFCFLFVPSETQWNHRLDWCGTEMARMVRLRFMKLLELLNAANEGYPDGYLAEYYDPNTGKRKSGDGDTLAKFIVLELIDTFDSKATDDAQIEEALRVLDRAGPVFSAS